MLNCQHHIQWVRQVAGGLHQCILCFQVVTKKDVYPKLEDLPPDFAQRWDAHEATRPPAAEESVPATPASTPAATAPATKPAASPRPPSAATANGTSDRSSAAAPQAASPQPSPSPAEGEQDRAATPPLPRPPPPQVRTGVPAAGSWDPRSGS